MNRTIATIGDALKGASDRLSSAGIDDSYREAVLLLARLVPSDPGLLYARREDPVDPAVARTFELHVGRRAAREPAAYIWGERSFRGHEFLVDGSTLIPRPETELLVDRVLSSAGPDARVLDIGTGSGCIAVSVALENPDAVVTATDVSGAALDIARRNAEKHGISGRIEFIRSDLYAQLGPAGGRDFDIIVSNPPYVETPVIPTLEPELTFEPRIALDGGDDGLAIIRPLIAGAPLFLRPNGRIFLEIGFDQSDRVSRLLTEAGFRDVRAERDLSGHHRILSGVLSGSI